MPLPCRTYMTPLKQRYTARPRTGHATPAGAAGSSGVPCVAAEQSAACVSGSCCPGEPTPPPGPNNTQHIDASNRARLVYGYASNHTPHADSKRHNSGCPYTPKRDELNLNMCRDARRTALAGFVTAAWPVVGLRAGHGLQRAAEHVLACSCSRDSR